MKRILTFLFLFSSLFASSQTQFLGAPNTTIVVKGNMKVDSILYLPKRSKTPTDTGALRYQISDSSLYVWTGSAWRKAKNDGTVTSVGLTMPSAFAVANSPVTTSGTLAVTATGSATEYIRGDGTLGTLPTSGGGGGSGVNYYLNGSVSQGTIGGSTYYEMSKTPIVGTGTNFTAAADGLIQQFITDAGDPNRLLIPAGAWNFELYFSASSAGGTPTFYVELLKYDGTTFTSISSSSASPQAISNGTTKTLYFTSLAVSETVLLATDRLAIRVYVNVSGRTITFYTEDANLAEIITTFAGGVVSLNGLTANDQFFATGTTGTNFNISSTSATHTFNLPTASATNRGALSSTDWSTFNNKVNISDTAAMLTPYTRGIGITGYIPKWTATRTQDTSQLFQTAGKILIGSTSDAGAYKVQVTGRILSTQDINVNSLTLGRGNSSIVTNSAFGYLALDSNTTGYRNNAIGYLALNKNTTGAFNSAFGYNSLHQNTTGNNNTGFGYATLNFLQTGLNNTAVGYQTLHDITSGSNNVGLGNDAGYSITTGIQNIAIGDRSMGNGSTPGANLGNYNIAIGRLTMGSIKSGDQNTAVGDASMFNFTGTGSYNVALGSNALLGNLTGGSNVALGFYGGAYELGSNSFYVNNVNQTNTANDKAYSLLYGTFAGSGGSLTGQKLRVNGKFEVATIDSTSTAINMLYQDVNGLIKKTAIITNPITGTGTTNYISKWIGTSTQTISQIFDNGTNVMVNTTTDNGNKFQVNGSAFISSDANISSLTIGKGASAISDNTAIGYQALAANTTGSKNAGIGYIALTANTTGTSNTAMGYNSQKATTTGNNNSSLGFSTMNVNTTGSGNTAFGYQTLFNNTTGSENTAIGSNALVYNTTGGSNIGIGDRAFGIGSTPAAMTGSYNIAIGRLTSASLKTGAQNTVVGDAAMLAASSGSFNVGIGSNALVNNATGNRNVALGFQAGGYETGSNSFYVNNVNQNNTSNDKAFSLLYGTFAGSASSLTGQKLRVNGNFEVSTIDSTSTARNMLYQDANGVIKKSIALSMADDIMTASGSWVATKDAGSGVTINNVAYTTNGTTKMVTIDGSFYIAEASFTESSWVDVATIPSGYRPSKTVNWTNDFIVSGAEYERADNTDFTGALGWVMSQMRIKDDGTVQINADFDTNSIAAGGTAYILIQFTQSYIIK